MLALLACAFVLQAPPVEQPVRLHTLLPNGAVILVERVPKSSTVSVQLFASSKGTRESVRTHGLRHLLEHLIAKGPKHDMDTRLESVGAFLNARTTRDVMQFTILAPASQLKLALDAASDVMRLPDLTPEEIAHEADVLDQETALKEPATLISEAAWAKAYGTWGLDPMGASDVIHSATLEDLRKIHRIQFAGNHLVMTIAGDVNLDEATKLASLVVGASPSVPSSDPAPPTAQGGGAQAGVYAEARAAAVGRFDDPTTIGAIAAGLAIASDLEPASFIYTPSSTASMIVVARLGETSGLASAFDQAEAKDLFPRGRQLALRWLQRQIASPDASASFRGFLLAQSPGLRPETIQHAIEGLTLADFRQGLELFRGPSAVEVGP